MQSPKSERKKVLVIRLSSLGDLVLSTSVLPSLRRAGYEISLVTKSNFASVLEGNPDIAEIHSFSPRTGSEAQARENFFRWYEERGFTFVLDLQDSWRTWTWRSRLKLRAPVYVAHKERLREWLIIGARLGAWLGFGAGGRARKFKKAAEDALLKEHVTNTSESLVTKLAVSDAEKASVKKLLPAGAFAVLLPVSAWKGKEWPYFAELASVLARKIPVVVLGGEKDLECDAVAESAKAVNPESRSLRGLTSMRESMAVLAQASWVIGNDTGMVHIAEALGKDVAMIEGPTHPSMGFSPYRPGSVLIGLNLVCRPCSKTGKFCIRFGTRKCLYGLTPQYVIEKLHARGYPC
ncbi:MAG: glycosyltransferase family 9 protein [Bdellovibrionota bacterium]